MANIITRTITVYTYRVAEMDKATMQVKVVKEITTVNKLGKREEARLAGKGQFMIPVETEDVTVGMALEDFYIYGTQIKEGDKADVILPVDTVFKAIHGTSDRSETTEEEPEIEESTWDDNDGYVVV